MMMKRPMMKKGGKALKKVKPSQKGLSALKKKRTKKANGGMVGVEDMTKSVIV